MWYLSGRTELEIPPLGVDEVCLWDVSVALEVNGQGVRLASPYYRGLCCKVTHLKGPGKLAPGPEEGPFEQTPE